MNYRATKKPKLIDEQNMRKITCPENVYKLDEVQEIKDAIQEHLMYIGLDNGNNVRDIDILGIGNSNRVDIDFKYIVRKALINANDKVILVHNHPSNSLEPSTQDKDFTRKAEKALNMFNIKLADHIIVTENLYASMKGLEKLNSKSKIIKDRDNEIER